MRYRRLVLLFYEHLHNIILSFTGISEWWRSRRSTQSSPSASADINISSRNRSRCFSTMRNGVRANKLTVGMQQNETIRSQNEMAWVQLDEHILFTCRQDRRHEITLTMRPNASNTGNNWTTFILFVGLGHKNKSR